MNQDNKLAILVPLCVAAVCLLGGCYTMFSHPNSEDLTSVRHDQWADCASCHTECVECDAWLPIFPRPINPIMGRAGGPGVTPVTGVERDSGNRGKPIPPNNKAVGDPIKPPSVTPGTPGTAPSLTPVKPNVAEEKEEKKKAKEKREKEDPKKEKREEPNRPPQGDLN